MHISSHKEYIDSNTHQHVEAFPESHTLRKVLSDSLELLVRSGSEVNGVIELRTPFQVYDRPHQTFSIETIRKAMPDRLSVQSEYHPIASKCIVEVLESSLTFLMYFCCG